MKKIMSLLMIMVLFAATFAGALYGFSYYKVSGVKLIEKQTLKMENGLYSMHFKTNTQKITIRIKNDKCDIRFEDASLNGDYSLLLSKLPKGSYEITVSYGVKTLFSQNIEVKNVLAAPLKDKLIGVLQDTRDSYTKEDGVYGQANILLMNFDIGVCQFIFGTKDDIVKICTDPIGSAKHAANSVGTVALILTPDAILNDERLNEKHQIINGFFDNLGDAYAVYKGLTYAEKRDFIEQSLGQIVAGSGAAYLTGQGAQQVLDKLNTTLKSAKALELASKLASKLRGGFTSLYRAVGPEEFYNIMETGKFSVISNGLQAKQFGLSLEETMKFAEKFSDIAAVIEVKVPAKSLKKLGDFTQVDKFIFKNGTVTIQADKLGEFNDVVKELIHKY